MIGVNVGERFGGWYGGGVEFLYLAVVFTLRCLSRGAGGEVVWSISKCRVKLSL